MIRMGKRIFVTGSAGFIGYHTALHLQSQGHFVIGCDTFHPYYSVALKKQRESLLQAAGIVTLPLNCCDTRAMEKVLQEYQITDVIHLAAQAGVRHSLTHPQEYVESNLQGFVSLLEALKTRPDIALVYASSSSVYGNHAQAPFREEDTTDTPSSLYGATKKCNEVIAYAYHHLFGICCTGLRFFTVYGPYGRPDMAYFSFTEALYRGQPIPVYGKGEPKRDFTYIDDIVSGITAAVHLRAPYEIFNLGHHHPYSVLELITLLEELSGKKAHLHFLPQPLGDVPLTYANITKAQEKLQFFPRVDLKEGLSCFLQWYLSMTKI